MWAIGPRYSCVQFQNLIHKINRSILHTPHGETSTPLVARRLIANIVYSKICKKCIQIGVHRRWHLWHRKSTSKLHCVPNMFTFTHVLILYYNTNTILPNQPFFTMFGIWTPGELSRQMIGKFSPYVCSVWPRYPLQFERFICNEKITGFE